MYTKDFIVGALAQPYCTYFLQHVSQEQGVLDEVWNKLFMGVFGTEEVSKYMLQSFARAMAGEIIVRIDG